MKKVSTVVPAWTEILLAAITSAVTAKGSPLNNDDVTNLAKTAPFVAAGKTVNMVRSKAVNMGKEVYQAAAPKSVGVSGVVVRKIKLVEAIETLANLKKGSLLSYEKASKPELELLSNSLTKRLDAYDADNAETIVIKTKVVAKIEQDAKLRAGSLKTLARMELQELQQLAGLKITPTAASQK